MMSLKLQTVRQYEQLVIAFNLYRLGGVAGEGESEDTRFGAQSLGSHQNTYFSYLKMWF